MSMPIESMLLAVNLNFLVFSVSSDDMMGQSFASLVPTVAAAESAIGLAIFVITFQAQEKSKEDPNRKRIIMTENEDFHLK
ncbi:NADH-ubiquinone oxidoreductase chain 4L [Linum grandiflorum]